MSLRARRLIHEIGLGHILRRIVPQTAPPERDFYCRNSAPSRRRAPSDQFPVGAVYLLVRERAIFPAVTARQRHALLARRYRSSLVHVEHFHALQQRRRALADRRDHTGRRNVTIHHQSEIAPDSRVPRWSDDLLGGGRKP